MCVGEVFQTSHDYNLAWGLPIDNKFDDFDHVSMSQVSQYHKLHIVLDSCQL